LPTERLVVGLCPAQVGLIHVRSSWRDKEISHRTLDVASPMDGLPDLLAGNAPHRAKATLVLSNRFVRFALVPWSDAASSTEEEKALAQACFESRYGDMTGWTIRFDAGEYGKARIACAVETAQLDACRELFSRHGLACQGVRPAFVAAWNRYRRELERDVGKEDAIFAMIEPGTLVMASRRAGAWHSLRSTAMRDDVRELPALIEREAVLQGFAAMPPVWIVAPGKSGSDLAAIPKENRWLRVLENVDPAATTTALGLAELEAGR
jgi:hypothetical protein